MTNKITRSIRQDCLDIFFSSDIKWNGSTSEPDFLIRIIDLRKMKSTDYRHKDAYEDITRHRIINPEDWNDDYILTDDRFDLLNCDDKLFLSFLKETLNPVHRNNEESEALKEHFNDILNPLGFKFIQTNKRGIIKYQYESVIKVEMDPLKIMFDGVNMDYIQQQIKRIENSIENDPSLAIGTSKELLETICKTILYNNKQSDYERDDLPLLIKKILKITNLDSDSETVKIKEIKKKMISGLANVVISVGEFRNECGTGHGREATSKLVSSTDARLISGISSSLAIYLWNNYLYVSKTA